MEKIVEFFRAGGFVMYPLAVLSCAAVFVIVERFLAYRTIAFRAPKLVNDVLASVEKDDFEGAKQMCAEVSGPVAATLGACLDSRGQSVKSAEGRVQEAGEEYFVQMERYLPVLDTTTTVSPLLGLLGTILGMIGTFQAVSRAKTAAATDSVLSGVGEALYATATGLIIAVICFISYNYFSARQRATIGATEIASTKLINILTKKGELKDHDI